MLSRLHAVRSFAARCYLERLATVGETARGKERLRRISLSATTSVLARGVAMGASFVSVPLTIQYLGSERYGMWMTITAIALTLSFADLGMGNGLLNAIAHASGNDDREAAARSVASTLYMLMAVASFIVLAVILSYPWIPWFKVFNLTSPVARMEAGPAVLVFVIAFALNLPLSLVQQIQAGYQEAFRSNAWQMAGALIGFGSLLIAINLKAGLPWLIAASSSGPLFATLANFGVELKFVRPWLLPRRRNFDWSCCKQMLQIGLAFFGIQLARSLTNSSDNFIIAQFLGPADVACYSVAAKLMGLVPFVSMLVLMPLWPAYGEAYSRGDLTWARTTLRRTAWVGLLTSVPASMALALFGPQLVDWWTRGQVHVPLSLFLALGISTVLTCSTYAHGVFLLGFNSVRFCFIAMVLVALFSIIAKLVLVPRWGLVGVTWGTAIPYVLLNGLPCVIYAPIVLAREQRKAAPSEPLVGYIC